MEIEEVLKQEKYNELTGELQKLNPQVHALTVGVDNIVALIGTTGVGKSTLTCYLKKAQLEFDKQGGGIYHIKYDNKFKGLPQIGHKSSCTTIPGVYKEKQNTYVDLAGWYDIRSLEQEIINSISNSQIFIRGKKVKILLVIQIQELTGGRGRKLAQNSNRLLQFFLSDFAKMMNSIILVVSKVNITEWTLEDIENKIINLCQVENQELKQNTKFFLQTLVRQKRIVIFPRPDQINDDYIKLLEAKIKMVRPTTLSHNGNITISQKALNMIHECVDFLNRDLMQLGNTFAADIQKKFNNQNYSSGEQVNNILNQLKTAMIILQKQFQSFQSSQKKTKLIEEFGKKVHASQDICDKMNKIFTMIYFYSSLNKNIRLNFRFISLISSKLNEVMANLQVVRNKLLSKEEMKKMEEQFEKILTLREEQNQQFLRKIQEQRVQFEQKLSLQMSIQQEACKKQLENSKYQKEKIQKQLKQLQISHNQSQIELSRLHHQVSQNSSNAGNQRRNPGDRSPRCSLI